MALSERQRRILEFIKSFALDNGYPPTIREIGEAVNIASTSVVNYNLNKLVEHGLIERAPKVSRGLWLSNQEAFSIRAQGEELAEVFLRGIAAT